MKILITEDDPHKLAEISAYAASIGFAEENILSASNMVDFMSKFDASVSICVIDLLIPAYDGAPVEKNGVGVLQAIDRIGAGHVKMLAISAYPNEFNELRPRFESRGCMIVSFLEKEVWQSALRLMSVQARSFEKKDFLIFCALRSERAPYTGMDDLSSRAVNRENISRLDVVLCGRSGSIIEMPRMGLTDAAITAAICIERFSPRLVAMSGICAGVEGRAELGQLLVSELAYEYQSGKWTADGFSQEPYQIPISEPVRTLLRELVDDAELIGRLEAGWTSVRPAEALPPKLATFTSGSAVIASEKFMEQVSSHHRRVSGLDMEIYALHRAAHLAKCRPEIICAKTVVDLGSRGKDDALQAYGCHISARFIVEAVASFFSQ